MSLASLRERLIERLAPASTWRPDGAPARSDFDLNPDAPRPRRTLRPAAVLVPIIARPDGATVLMTRRSDSLASHTGQIAFPGGRLDPGETAGQAALREAWEEVALDPSAVEVLGVGDGYETVTGFMVTPVVGWLAEPPVVSPSPDEVAEVFEAPWDFLMDPANHRREFHDPESGPRRWFWAMPWRERYIWGATAAIVRALRGRLYGDEAEPAAAVDEDAA
ncbi:CoA pyrophosphatase [Brevundimonas sp.]|uniref:CoA pyrophosphatase n=1 Tax=Brevundimonas sp. TaxID=1871086 RepID=UPI002D392EFA|nr:CoA pyrophosphatase [Brevundimonas sp.]HYD28263.1 CoA pyrophosphatase [Brevundimonas sp.]